jgi:hypothetical protein
MNIDDVNVKILESLKEEGQKGEHQEVIGELEQQGYKGTKRWRTI